MIMLARKNTEFGEITILRSRATGAVAYCHGDHYQSEADPNGISLAGYIHALHALVAQTAAKDVLMIGCGGGTLGTMLKATGQQVTVVDINPESIALAQEYFALPPEIACHIGDGEAFLEDHPKLYDAIVVDAFAGDKVPPNLCSAAFFKLARSRLTASGSLFLNIFVAHDLDADADRIAGRMAEAGFPVRLLDLPGRIVRNVIVMGGAVMSLQPPSLLLLPALEADAIAKELEQMRFRGSRARYRVVSSAKSAELSEG
ncbi:MAG: spermidine synthase [Hypericibacter sp.]